MIDILKDYMFLFYRSDSNIASIGVKGCGYHAAVDHYHWGPGERPFHLLYHVIEGEGVMVFRGNEYSVSSGDTFLVYPNEEHSLTSRENVKWAYSWVGFSGNDILFFLEQIGFSPINPVKHVGDATVIMQLVESMYEHRGDSLRSASEMTGYLFLLLSNLSNTGKSETDNAIFQAAMDYIRRHDISTLSVQSICEDINVSRSWLFRLFDEYVGQSPMQYLMDIRINKARNLLFHSERTVAEIAIQCGFSDPLYFSRCFHNHTGLSPTKFRTMARNDMIEKQAGM